MNDWKPINNDTIKKGGWHIYKAKLPRDVFLSVTKVKSGAGLNQNDKLKTSLPVVSQGGFAISHD